MRTTLGVIITTMAIGAWLSAEEAPDETKPTSRAKTSSIDLSLGFSAPDVMDLPGLAIKPKFSWNIAESGFVIGITDAEFPILPQAAGGEISIFQEFGGNLPDCPVTLSFGNYNSFSLEESNPIFGHLYGKAGLALGDIEGLVEFQLDFEPAYLKISLEPNLIMADTPHFAFEPSIALGLIF